MFVAIALGAAFTYAGDAVSVFYKNGTETAEDFSSVKSGYTFDVVNSDTNYMMLVFDPTPDAKISPNIVRLDPKSRKTVSISVENGVKSFALNYSIAFSKEPFRSNGNQYRAMNDGETTMIVPVSPELYAAVKKRAENIFNGSKTVLTDKAMPPRTVIYTPGPAYAEAGLFARDFLYQLEGGGRDLVTADEVKAGVEYLASLQLAENRIVGGFTYPKGAIPDHIYPDGRYSWGPGLFYGDVPGHFNRPSMDESMCFVLLAAQYGLKANWDAAWQTWFKANATKFENAWNSVPLNPKNGLVTQWSTPGHIGANGIAEFNGSSVMWGFHDSYGFAGDDVGVSVLACNAARALTDMHGRIANDAASAEWKKKADAMQKAVQSQFNPKGYLPWGVGEDAPTMASPDITGYAIWSDILTPEQSQAASDWFAAIYAADKASGGAADMFQMAKGMRGAVRMARKSDDVYPGTHVWPRQKAPNWDNLALGYGNYQDGAYWYYMSLGVAKALWVKHPAVAKEWVADTFADIAEGSESVPYERIDANGPANDKYNASVGPVLGMGMPAEVIASVKVHVTP
jgi:hypothetical protein